MRNRTPKTLGTRHEPGYVHRPTGFGKWRFWLGLGITISAAVVLLAAFPLKNKGTIYSKVYSKGPVSSAHSFIAEKCELCHVAGGNNPQPAGFVQNLMHGVSDQACLKCHEAPVHHQGDNQPTAPSCASCHVEHQGHHALFHLSHVQGRSCVNCHKEEHVSKTASQLGKASDTCGGSPNERQASNADAQASHAPYIYKSILRFNGDIPGINGNHPEFKAAAERMRLLDDTINKKDKTFPGIVFHHAQHVGPTLETLKHRLVTLNCSDCHRPVAENDAPWNYSNSGMVLSSNLPSSGQQRHPDAGRELMSMPTFEKNCAGCHAIPFDGHFGDSAPHLKSNCEPELRRLHVFIATKLQDYIHKYPNAIHVPDPSVPQVPEMQPLPLASGPKEWVDQRVSRAEKDVLAAVKCRYCHQMDSFRSSPPDLSQVPVVKRSDFKSRQMPISVFSHEAHITLTCGSCHGDLPAVRGCCQDKTRVMDPDIPDVKLPGIKTCESCHNGNPSHAGNAENSCFLCHQYHRWNERDDLKHPPANYTLQQLGLPGS